MNWKKVTVIKDFIILIFCIIVLIHFLLSLNYENKIDNCIIIEKDEAIDAAWKLIDAQNRLIQHLSNQNKIMIIILV